MLQTVIKIQATFSVSESVTTFNIEIFEIPLQSARTVAFCSEKPYILRILITHPGGLFWSLWE